MEYESRSLDQPVPRVLFVRIGNVWVRPAAVVAITDYKGTNSSSLLFVDGVADPIRVSVSVPEAIKILEGF